MTSKESENFSSLRPSPDYMGGTLGKLKILGFFAFLILIFFLSLQSIKFHRPVNIKMVTIAGQTLVVDVADTKGKQEQGLSGRKELKEDEGMLFIFEDPDRHSFWMKDMNFAIDIIWIGDDMHVVYIKKYAQPEEYPNTYVSNKDAKYVLEVVSGFSEKNNLRLGDKAKFSY